MKHAFDTARLTVRPLDGRDGALYCRLYTDPDVMRLIGPPMAADAAARSFVTALRLNGQGAWPQRWALVDLASSADIGLLGLVPHPDAPAAVEVGVMLLPAWQGRGIASEVIAAAAEGLFALDAPAIAGLWTRHEGTNGLAIGLMRKLGFRREDGEDWRWRLSRTDWKSLNESA
jgi:RimJ/RimL family protein N-acetyltransferase